MQSDSNARNQSSVSPPSVGQTELVVPNSTIIGHPEQVEAGVGVVRDAAHFVDQDARSMVRSYRRLREGRAHDKWLIDEPKTWERFCQEALGDDAAFLDAIERGVQVLERISA